MISNRQIFFTFALLVVAFVPEIAAQSGDTIIIGNQHQKHHECICPHYTPVHEPHYTPVHEPHFEHGHEEHGYDGGEGGEGGFRRKRSIIRIITTPVQPLPSPPQVNSVNA